MPKKMQETDDGYMVRVMQTLNAGEMREFALSSVNVDSWRTTASRVNKKAGYRKYSIIKSGRLGKMYVKHNIYE